MGKSVTKNSRKQEFFVTHMVHIIDVTDSYQPIGIGHSLLAAAGLNNHPSHLYSSIPNFPHTQSNATSTCLSTFLNWCWISAMYLSEWRGTTLSSWSPVSRSMDGYCRSPGGTRMLWRGEYLRRQRKSTSWRQVKCLTWAFILRYQSTIYCNFLQWWAPTSRWEEA